MSMVASHWSASPLVLAGCAVAAAVHLRGTAAAAADARRPGGGRPAGTAGPAIAFYLGLLVLTVALVSPIGYWAQRYIWVRSIQDVLLATAAPALIVLGAPWAVLRRALGRAGAAAGPDRAGDSPDRAADSPGRAGRAWPVAVTVAFSVAWWAWHVPALYDAALRDPAVYAAEVLCYLGLGIALWLQLIGPRPRLMPVERVVLAVGTLASTSVLAMGLVFGSWLLYPAYAGRGHQVLSVVADQQVGGAILWTLTLPPFFIAAVALLVRWLKQEGSEALMSGLEQMLRPRKWTWPSRPGLR